MKHSLVQPHKSPLSTGKDFMLFCVTVTFIITNNLKFLQRLHWIQGFEWMIKSSAARTVTLQLQYRLFRRQNMNLFTYIFILESVEKQCSHCRLFIAFLMMIMWLLVNNWLTFGTNSPKRMDVVLVDKLFLQDHLHRSNDLSHDDQKVSCRTEQREY